MKSTSVSELFCFGNGFKVELGILTIPRFRKPSYAAPLHEGDQRPRSEPQGDDEASIMNFDAHETFGKDLVEAVSDSNFATNRNTRKSLSSGRVRVVLWRCHILFE